MNSTVIENAAFPHILVGKGRKAIDITGPCLSESWEGPGRMPSATEPGYRSCGWR